VQLTPRYDGPPVLRFEGSAADPGGPMLRQRRRLGSVLSGLTADEWAAPSRCEKWSVRDVVAHLVSTNQFWALSFSSGRAGNPTRFLATFDPVASPVQLVDALADVPAEGILEQYLTTVDGMAAAVEGFDEDAWAMLGEAPPGHVSLHEVALHALWDAWIHERDVLLPLGRTQELAADEVKGCLQYVAALGPSFHAAQGSTREGALAVEATDPDVSFVVRAGTTVVVDDGPAPDGAPVLRGDAVALVEGLSFRDDVALSLPEDDRWLLGGLDRVFDRV
jgi:uncharacterized protein (TIGR03083 family)